MNPRLTIASQQRGAYLLAFGTFAAIVGLTPLACTSGGDPLPYTSIDPDAGVDSGGPSDGGGTDSSVDTGTSSDAGALGDAFVADSGPPPPGATAAVASFGTNPGGLKMYLHTPGRVAAGAPIVVALHGCAQGASDYAAVGWDALADARGFYVIYAEQTTSNNFNRCFRWYESAQTGQGGEAASIAAMVSYVRSTAGAGKNYVTGVSSGGAMAAAMVAAYPDVFTAASIDAGIPYRCATSIIDSTACQSGTTKTAQAWGDLVRAVGSNFTKTRVQLWHGSSDAIVSPTNLGELTKQWTNVAGLSETATTSNKIGVATHKTFVDGTGVVRVESFEIPNMSHGVAIDTASSCGQAAPYILDVGFCSSRYAADFFGL